MRLIRVFNDDLGSAEGGVRYNIKINGKGFNYINSECNYIRYNSRLGQYFL